MAKVGITGQAGFMGTHLFQSLKLKNKEFELIPFEDHYFSDENRLLAFVKQCDAIVHLAALNRHADPKVIYETNIALVKKLINACGLSGNKPHIIFSSSTQEKLDNLYGKSKLEGRQLFEGWAASNKSRFTSLLIPNVFGPFGLPNYNSVVATFCHKLANNETPEIINDAEINLVFINDLVEVFIKAINMQLPEQETQVSQHVVKHSKEIKVSVLLQKLVTFKTEYLENNSMPDLANKFDKQLFLTFHSYINFDGFYPVALSSHTDARGSFTEIIRLKTGGQVSFSTTKPGITRGNHFHTRKIERFAVIKGKARIELRKVGENKIHTFEIDGAHPAYVDMPVWHTHNLTNIGKDDLYTLFWINEFFDENDPDTFWETV